MTGSEKRFAADVDGIEVGPEGAAAGDTYFIRRGDGKRFDGFGGVVGEIESELRAKRRQIIEAHDGVFGKALVQIIGKSPGASGIANQGERQSGNILGVAAVGSGERIGGALAGFGGVSIERFPERGSGFAAGGDLFFAGETGRGGGLARESASGSEFSGVGRGAGFEREHGVFFSGLAHGPGNLARHSVWIVFQKCDFVEVRAQVGGIEIFSQGVFGGGARVAETIEMNVAEHEIGGVEAVRGSESHGRAKLRKRFIVLAERLKDDAEIGGGTGSRG